MVKVVRRYGPGVSKDSSEERSLEKNTVLGKLGWVMMEVVLKRIHQEIVKEEEEKQLKNTRKLEVRSAWGSGLDQLALARERERQRDERAHYEKFCKIVSKEKEKGTVNQTQEKELEFKEFLESPATPERSVRDRTGNDVRTGKATAIRKMLYDKEEVQHGRIEIAKQTGGECGKGEREKENSIQRTTSNNMPYFEAKEAWEKGSKDEASKLLSEAYNQLNLKFGMMELRVNQLENNQNAMGFGKEEKRAIREEVNKKIQEVENIRKKEWKKREEWLDERRVEEDKRYRIRRNVTVTGCQNVHSKEDAEEGIRHLLGLEITVRRLWRISGREGSERKIGLEIASIAEKKKLMSRKSILKERGEDIFFDNDTTYKQRRIREEVWEKAKKLREGGRRIRVGYKKIQLGKEIWFFDEEKMFYGEDPWRKEEIAEDGDIEEEPGKKKQPV